MKKIISVILSICVILTCFSISVFAEENDTNLVVLGDSIAYGTTMLNADVQSFGAILADTNGWNYTNCSVPGHTTQAFSARLDEEDVQAAISEADIILISIGGNNFLLDGLIGIVADGLINQDYSKMDAIIEEFNVSFAECMGKIKALNPTARVYLETMYNPMEGDLGVVYGTGTAKLNAAYRAYLDSNPGAYTIVDVASKIDGHPEYINFDYTHPTAAGHIVIAETYQEQFYADGIVDSPEIVEPTVSDIAQFDIIAKLKDLLFQIKNAFNLVFGGYITTGC